MPGGSLVSKAASTYGLAPGTKFFTPFPFRGMNTHDGPAAINDAECLWCENFLLLGDANLRTAWDVGPNLHSVLPGYSIVSFFFFTIGTVSNVALFLSDGSAIQVNTTTGQSVTIGLAGTFYKVGGSLPACAQWGTLYLLISNRNTVNDYWAWDGTTLYTAGGAAPNAAVLNASGSGYTSLPTVTAFGGEGTGMVLTPSIQAGAVVQLAITNPGTGYQVADIVQAQFSGGGSDTGAILTANLNVGGVAAVNVTAPGSDYTSAPAVGFSGGGGTGAAGTALIGTGVATLTITAGGSGYTGATVAFSGGGGSGATATANVLGGMVTGLTLTSPGTDYTSNPTVTISGDGTLATATATIQGGIVTGITITAPGTDYTSAPTIALTSGGGTGATAQAILSPTSVSGVTVTNGGTDYLYAPNINFVGGGGAGAAGTVVLTGTSIAKVNLTAGGQNYGTTQAGPTNKLPTVSFTGGGGGSGAAANVVLADGAVAQIVVTDGGSGYTTNVEVVITPYNDPKNPQNDDQGTGAGGIAIFKPTSIASVLMSNYGLHYTTAPTIEIEPGGNNAASAIIAMMPFGVSGDSLETYQQRAWIANPCPQSYAILPPGGNWQVSAPGGFTDFATSDGGVLFTNSDGFLQTRYTSIRQSNGYLYFFGDGSISVVSSVSTSGSPSTTTFNYQNVDPQTGLSWRDSQQEFGRTVVFANETGIFALYGGAATKISQKMDGVFSDAIFPTTQGALTPSAASVTLFGRKHYLLLMTIADPDTGAPRNAMVTWNEKEWSITSQGQPLTYIGSQKVDSVFTAWGTDGIAIFPLFQTPSATLPKKWYSKVYGGGPSAFMIKDVLHFTMQGQDQSADLTGINCTVGFVASGLAAQNPNFPSVPSILLDSDVIYGQPSFAAPPPYWPVFAAGAEGLPFMTLQMKLTTTSTDFVLANIGLGYVNELAATG